MITREQAEALEIAAKLAENHHLGYEKAARSLVKKVGDDIAATIRRMIHDVEPARKQ